MDRIVIPGIPLEARVGVSEDEMAGAQEVRVHLVLHVDLSAAGASDSLEDTVDYEAVCAAVADVVGRRPFKLIESMAAEVAAEVLRSFAVEEIEVRIEKPGALRARGVPFAAVELRRNRHA